MSKLAANLLITAENDPLQAERIWIAFCEAAAALFCLRRILPYCEPGSTLVFHEDNQNVVSWLKKLRCASKMSAPVIQEIAWLLACYNVELDVRTSRRQQTKLQMVAPAGLPCLKQNAKNASPTTCTTSQQTGRLQELSGTESHAPSYCKLWMFGLLQTAQETWDGSHITSRADLLIIIKRLSSF